MLSIVLGLLVARHGQPGDAPLKAFHDAASSSSTIAGLASSIRFRCGDSRR